MHMRGPPLYCKEHIRSAHCRKRTTETGLRGHITYRQELSPYLLSLPPFRLKLLDIRSPYICPPLHDMHTILYRSLWYKNTALPVRATSSRERYVLIRTAKIPRHNGIQSKRLTPAV